MLEDSSTPTSDALQEATQDTQTAAHAVQQLRDLIERMQAELKFEKTRNEALNFEIARFERWRFGSFSESLDTSTQGVLFDAILAAAGGVPRAGSSPAPRTSA